MLNPPSPKQYPNPDEAHRARHAQEEANIRDEVATEVREMVAEQPDPIPSLDRLQRVLEERFLSLPLVRERGAVAVDELRRRMTTGAQMADYVGKNAVVRTAKIAAYGLRILTLGFVNIDPKVFAERAAERVGVLFSTPFLDTRGLGKSLASVFTLRRREVALRGYLLRLQRALALTEERMLAVIDAQEDSDRPPHAEADAQTRGLLLELEQLMADRRDNPVEGPIVAGSPAAEREERICEVQDELQLLGRTMDDARRNVEAARDGVHRGAREAFAVLRSQLLDQYDTLSDLIRQSEREEIDNPPWYNLAARRARRARRQRDEIDREIARLKSTHIQSKRVQDRIAALQKRRKPVDKVVMDNELPTRERYYRLVTLHREIGQEFFDRPGLGISAQGMGIEGSYSRLPGDLDQPFTTLEYYLPTDISEPERQRAIAAMQGDRATVERISPRLTNATLLAETGLPAALPGEQRRRLVENELLGLPVAAADDARDQAFLDARGGTAVALFHQALAAGQSIPQVLRDVVSNARDETDAVQRLAYNISITQTLLQRCWPDRGKLKRPVYDRQIPVPILHAAALLLIESGLMAEEQRRRAASQLHIVRQRTRPRVVIPPDMRPAFFKGKAPRLVFDYIKDRCLVQSRENPPTLLIRSEALSYALNVLTLVQAKISGSRNAIEKERSLDEYAECLDLIEAEMSNTPFAVTNQCFELTAEEVQLLKSQIDMCRYWMGTQQRTTPPPP